MNERTMVLDIIIPVYNRLPSFHQLLDTLTHSISTNNQLIDKVKIIIVDDSSASSVVFNQEKSGVVFELVRNKKNLGAPSSRLKGLERARAQYVHFHDSDDNVDEYWLLALIEYLTENPETDILLSARTDVDKEKESYKYQKFFHNYHKNPERIAKRLIYRNCLGPLGGATFSRHVLERIEFKNFASCQDWQMYIYAMNHAKVLASRPDIKFIFNKTGDDRISHNPRKKILGHLQLSKITSRKSPFNKNIRLFYLYTCKQHIFNKGGQVLTFYKKYRIKIILTYLVVSVYWRIT